MPYKLRNSHCHKFPKTTCKITNWKEYNQALINRGSVTLHLPGDVIKAWRPKKCKHKLQGAQFQYSDIAIQAAVAINTKHGNDVTVAIPPRTNAALSANYNKSPTKRDHNILFVEKYSKYRWQDYSDYNYRALAETGMFRYKTLISERLFSRRFTAQKLEVRIACRALNRLTALGVPRSFKIKRVA